MGHPSRDREKGIVLIITMIILTLLIIIIMQMSTASSHNRHISENYLNDLQLTFTIKSGFEHAVLLLSADCTSGPNLDSLNEKWAAPFKLDIQGTSLNLQIVDESSKYNLTVLVGKDKSVNETLKNQLIRLFTILGHDTEIVNSIIEYLKENTIRVYEDLLNVKSMTPEVLFGISKEDETKKGIIEFITLWPKFSDGGTPMFEDFKINVNTAPVEVLQSLSDYMSAEIASNIVSYRQTLTDSKYLHFQTIIEVKNVVTSVVAYNSISPFIKTKSNYYSLAIKGTAGRLEKELVYVVKKDIAKKTANYVTNFILSRHMAIKPKKEN